jgi:O-methyltransferase domain/Dimerisation domain
MTQDSRTGPGAPPAHMQLVQMSTAFWVSRIVYVAARLGLADHLASGPKSSAEIARATQTHPRSLYRLMRTLASLGLFSEAERDRFSLTPLGEALRTGAPGAARSTVLAFGGNWFWRPWEELEYSIRTGQTAMEKVWGMGAFDYLAKDPEAASLFNDAMIGVHGSEPAAVAAAYDFSRFGTIVDVGGGTGNLLSTILARHAGPRGVLYDRPYVVPEASKVLESRGVAGRVKIEPGDFFERVPSGGDAYVLSHVIHDWTEERCLTILGNCRKAMTPASTLLIVEFVLPPGDAPHFGKLLDIVMLAMPGGEERTEREYAELLRKAGFELCRVVPTESQVGIVEAVLA